MIPRALLAAVRRPLSTTAQAPFKIPQRPLSSVTTGWPSLTLRNVFWRGLRVARIGVLSIGLYQAGKSSGHVEVLEDPDGVAKKIIQEIIVSSHADDGKGKNPGWYKRDTPLHRRVRKVGEKVLQAARDEVKASLAQLPKNPSAEQESAVNEQREALESALQRLRGTWHWVVTNSDAPNAFVTPYCPRRVFVTEGLLHKVNPTDDELAFILGHELSHVIHGHGQKRIEQGASLAALQLMIFALIDPTGLGALAIVRRCSIANSPRGCRAASGMLWGAAATLAPFSQQRLNARTDWSRLLSDHYRGARLLAHPRGGGG